MKRLLPCLNHVFRLLLLGLLLNGCMSKSLRDERAAQAGALRDLPVLVASVTPDRVYATASGSSPPMAAVAPVAPAPAPAPAPVTAPPPPPMPVTAPPPPPMPVAATDGPVAASGPPAPAPEVQREQNGSLNWAYWIDARRTRNKSEPIAGALKLREQYWFRARLTSQNLAREQGMGNIVASTLLESAVGKAVADSKDALELVVLIHPSDDVQVQIDARERRQTLKVNLASMRKDRARQPTPDTPLERDDITTIFGEIAFKFRLMTAGRQQVAISIIDAVSGFPLQNLVAELDTDKPWPASASLNADGQAQLSSSDVPADLALSLYELNSTVNGMSYPSLQAELRHRDKATGKLVYYQWKTDTTIAKLKQSALTFKSESDDFVDSSELLRAGFDMAQTIFAPTMGPASNAARERNKRTAASARRAIITASQYKDGETPPTMLVRIVDGSNIGSELSSVLLPIGALGVSMDTPANAVYLGERFSLALVLAGQVPGVVGTCPKSWYVALPTRPDTPGALQEAYDGTRATAGKWPSAFKEQGDALTDLRTWFSPADEEAQPPHVFAFIGHHGSGRLFFDQSTGGMDASSMRRDFAGTSIAILNACNSAMGDIDEASLIGHLAKTNVASVIATTSSISGHLAAAYMQCMDRVLTLHPSPTIGQSHALATQCLRNRGPAKVAANGVDFSGNAFKYILVGNPHQSICAPEQKLVAENK